MGIQQMELSNQVSLGNGRGISPPAGWVQDGFTAENPLWVRPKGRIRWHPPGNDDVALHWSLSVSPLAKNTMDDLLSLMNSPSGDIDLDALKALNPGLIRMPTASLLRARLLEFENSGPLICVEYAFEDSNEAGFICYSATEKHESGEYQILGYEGKQPAFDDFLDVGIAAIQSFSIKQSDAESDAAETDAPTYTVGERETIKMIVSQKWPDLPPDEVAAKAREIYAFNLSRGNVLKAWDLTPGSEVFLPE
jgi:hypothetical protein